MRGTMLAGCRALDLTDEKGFLCGKMLADLGVEVVKIEPPGGDRARNVGPFWHERADDPEASLYWMAYNADKRGITLDLESDDGKAIFLDLVRGADFVLESFGVGHLDRLGLGYETLRALRPSLVMTSITPFGQTGPYSGYAASELVVMALSGHLFLTGDADRAPLNFSLAQACLHAGADAAVGSMTAYRHARRTGRGQRVDVSMQQSAAWFLATTIPWLELADTTMTRVGTFRSGGANGATQRQVWPCRDGYVFFFMVGGAQGAKTARRFVRWMQDEGVHDEFLSSFEWEKFDMGKATQSLVDRISAPIEKFLATRTKREVLEAAASRSVSICPLSSMADLLADRNLVERGFWAEQRHPAIGASLPYPQRFVRSSENDTSTRAPAPTIGQDNEAIYAALGIDGARLQALRSAGVV